MRLSDFCQADIPWDHLQSGAGAGGQRGGRADHPQLKEQLLWVRTFDTAEELLVAPLEFNDRYNRRYNRGWLCERHGHQTPA